MKKLATLILVSFSLFGLFACEKEEEPPTHFTGYVLEAGTGNPVRKANVAIFCKDHETGGLSIAAETISDDKGFYSIENKYQADGKAYYMVAQASDYYPQHDYYYQKIYPTTRDMNLTLFRKTKLKFHVRDLPINLGSESIVITTQRNYAIFSEIGVDTIIGIDVNAFVENKIYWTISQNSVVHSKDTTLIIMPNSNQLIELSY